MNPGRADQEHVVYRMYGGSGQLLYIGMTHSMRKRLTQHRSLTPWFGEVFSVTSVPFQDREDALTEEARAIRSEQPLYNIVHRIAA